MNAATATTPAFAELPLPPLAQRLAYLGLVPFALGAALIWLFGDRYLDAHALVSLGLTSYAGLVIAFLGGIYWGLGFKQEAMVPQHFLWGIAPVAVGWIGVVMPAYSGLVLEGAMLIVCYLVDRRFYPELGAASWLTLRFRLSAISALFCFLAAAGC